MKALKSLIHLCNLITICILLMVIGCKKIDSLPKDNNTNSIDTTSVDYNNADSSFKNGDFKLTEYDIPPTPIQNPMPAYPVQYKESGIQGVVLLEVEVSEDGVVNNVKIIKSLLAGEGALDETAVTTVKNWIFKPAMKKNRPVSSRINIPIPFSLKSYK